MARAALSPSITGLVLSREAPKEVLQQETSVQAEADRRKQAVPEFVTGGLRQGQGRGVSP
jgi:acetyl-CoA C-acetyltransferase